MQSETAQLTERQKFAIRGLKEIAEEHFVPNIHRLDHLEIDITDGRELSHDRMEYYVTIEGDCRIDARVSVHGATNGVHLVTVFLLVLRRYNSQTTITPNMSFERQLA